MDLSILLPIAEAVADAGGGGDLPGLVGQLVVLIKTGGPLTLAVLAGIWAIRKDREKEEVQKRAVDAAKANYDQMVALVASQTAAMVKMEATVGALKDVITAQDRRRERDRERT